MVTTEVIILLLCFFFVALSLVGKLGTTFDGASPKLGAKLEKQIETGSAFAEATQGKEQPVSWQAPTAAPGVPKR